MVDRRLSGAPYLWAFYNSSPTRCDASACKQCNSRHLLMEGDIRSHHVWSILLRSSLVCSVHEKEAMRRQCPLSFPVSRDMRKATCRLPRANHWLRRDVPVLVRPISILASGSGDHASQMETPTKSIQKSGLESYANPVQRFMSYSRR